MKLRLLDSLHVESFWAAMGGTAVIGLCAAIIGVITRSFERELSGTP